jgi:hypothetical protein
MPDFGGGLLSAFQIAFDPDGSKTDKLMGKDEGGDEGPSYEPYPWAHKRKRRGKSAPGSGRGPKRDDEEADDEEDETYPVAEDSRPGTGTQR